jgi:hypothetical protein
MIHPENSEPDSLEESARLISDLLYGNRSDMCVMSCNVVLHDIKELPNLCPATDTRKIKKK